MAKSGRLELGDNIYGHYNIICTYAVWVFVRSNSSSYQFLYVFFSCDYCVLCR